MDKENGRNDLLHVSLLPGVVSFHFQRDGVLRGMVGKGATVLDCISAHWEYYSFPLIYWDSYEGLRYIAQVSFVRTGLLGLSYLCKRGTSRRYDAIAATVTLKMSILQCCF